MSKTNQQPSKNRSKDHNTDLRQSNIDFEKDKASGS